MSKTVKSILLVFLTILFPCSLEAKTIKVPTQFETIQDAINSANDGDVILVAPGTYTGDGNRDIDFLGKAIVLRSKSGPLETIIDCQATDKEFYRGFIFQNYEDSNSILDGFTIKNGFGDWGTAGISLSSAGGIAFDSASPLISNCIITENVAHIGGALLSIHSNPIFENCTIINNSWAAGQITIVQSNPIFRNCLLGEGFLCLNENNLTIKCTDYLGQWNGCLAPFEDVDGNFTDDPKFCKNSLFLQDSSPCLPKNNSCGELIGAVGEGCIDCDYISLNCPNDRVLWISVDDTTAYIEIQIENADSVLVSDPHFAWKNDSLHIDVDSSGIYDIDFTPISDCDTVYCSLSLDIRLTKTIIVPDHYPNISEAVANAERGDTILIRDGTYSGPENRDIVIDIDRLVIISENGHKRTRIDCQGSQFQEHRAFIFRECKDVKIQGITIMNGFAFNGGGILIDGKTTLNLDKMYLWNNVAIAGGAVAVLDESRAYFNDCQFRSNKSDISGGAIAIESPEQMTIYDCYFIFNDVKEIGGAIFAINSSDLDIDRSTFRYNTAKHGGAIYFYECDDVNIGNSEFRDNEATSKGGAVKTYRSNLIVDQCVFSLNVSEFGGGIDVVKSQVLVINCDFMKNQADFGGGFYSLDTKTTIQSCMFSLNEALYHGGGLAIKADSVSIDSTIFSNNVANWGGGIDITKTTILNLNNCTITNNTARERGSGLHISESWLDMKNTLIAFNSGRESIACNAPAKGIAIECTNIYGNDGNDWVGCIREFENDYNNISADPLFCDEFIGNYEIQSGSPCAATNNNCNVLIGALDVGCIKTDVTTEQSGTLPQVFSMSQNYPNPFNPSTIIEFQIPKLAQVNISIYNILGQNVKILVDQELSAGNYKVDWNGQNELGVSVSTGVYFYKIVAGDFVEKKKMLLLK